MRSLNAAVCSVLLCSISVAQDARHYAQPTEPQEAVAKTEIGKLQTQEATDTISDANFSQGAKPIWIWGPDNNRNYVLRTRF